MQHLIWNELKSTVVKSKMNNNPSIFEIVINENDHLEFKRLDHLLTHHLKDQSRAYIQGLFKKGMISSPTANKLELKKIPPVGTTIEIRFPELQDSKAKAENIPLEILFEDEHLLVINKQAGIVTHPAPGNYTGTLVNAVLHHCPDLTGIGDEKRPGIVHRLDKGTSGVMVVAKTQRCHEGLVKLFSTHDITRLYEAIGMGIKIPNSGQLKSTIGRDPRNRLKMAIDIRNGKEAITNYKVIKFFNNFTHIELKLETGRTHQIRVHLNSLLNMPILCDPLYGNPIEHRKRIGTKYHHLISSYKYPLLHAKTLSFVHPITKLELEFNQPPPRIFQEILQLGEVLNG